jgi:hypothetical protein
MDYVQVKTDSELRCLCDHTVLENIEGGKVVFTVLPGSVCFDNGKILKNFIGSVICGFGK